jgi:hypothetical protein
LTTSYGGRGVQLDSALSVGTWRHVVAVCDGPSGVDNMTIYINGQKPAQSDWGTVGLVQNLVNPRLRIGGAASGTTDMFDGKISQFKLYDTALTAEEVKTLYDMGRCDEGHHVVNFSKTRVGIGLGDGEAPKGALDVRGDVHFHNIVHMLATDSAVGSSFDSANGVYANFDTVQEGYGIAMEGINGTFRITEQAGAGLYMVNGQVSMAASTNVSIRNASLRIHKNNAEVYGTKGYGLSNLNYVDGTTYSLLSTQLILRCEVGDTIRLYLSSGSASIYSYIPTQKMLIYKMQSI